MMQVMRLLQVSLGLLVLTLVPKTGHGWGTIGHEVVANVAWAALSDEAQSWVIVILATNSTTASSTGSTTTATNINRHAHFKGKDARNVGEVVRAMKDEDNSPLGMVADWADQVRHFLPWSAPLHYIDVRDDLLAHGCHVNPSLNPQCRFLYERDCPDDTCVAGAIVNYTYQLKLQSQLQDLQPCLRGTLTSTIGTGTTRADSKAKKEALMFLTHFIGDIHQPLHCSRVTDKGGNDIHVHFHVSTQSHSHSHHAWNLHSVWDSGLIEVALARDYNNSRLLLEQHLIAQLDTAKQKYLDDCDPALGANRTCTILWGQESWDEAVHYAYTMSDNRTDVTDGSTLDEEYFQTRWPLVMDRLLAGAVRLAGTLEWLVQQNNKQTEVIAQAPNTSTIDRVVVPSFWSRMFSNAWSWTCKSRIFVFAPSYYF